MQIFIIRRKATIFCFFILSIIFQESLAVNTDASKINLVPISVPSTASATAIQLKAQSGKVYLFFSATVSKSANQYETVIKNLDINETSKHEKNVFVLPQLLPPPPNWNITAIENDQYSVVIEVAGGATNSLLLKSTNGSELSIVSKVIESYSNPKFIVSHSLQYQMQLSVIVDNKKLAMVTVSGGQYNSQNLGLDASQAAIVDIQGHKYAIYKTDLTGKVRANNLSPGNLSIVSLDNHNKISGLPYSPLGDNLIYEFDLAVVNEKLTIFSTTEAGVNLSSFIHANRKLLLLKTIEQEYPNEYVKPSIVHASNNVTDNLYLAVMDFPRNSKTIIYSATVNANAVY